MLPYTAEAALGEDGDLEGLHPGRFDGGTARTAGIAAGGLLVFDCGGRWRGRCRERDRGSERVERVMGEEDIWT